MIIKYLYLLLFSTTILHAMEKEITHWFQLPPEVITKIFACADPATKSKIYFLLREKFLIKKFTIKREELLNHSPLLLSRKQSMHLMIEAAKENDQEKFMRLLHDAQYCNHYVFNIASTIFTDDSYEYTILNTYSEQKNKILLEKLVPYIMQVYKGGKDIRKQYATNYHDKHPREEKLTPLQIAVLVDHDAIAELFLMQDRELVTTHDPILIDAVLRNKLKICALILSCKQIALNTIWLHGLLPLHYAAQEGNLEMLKLLIAHGADINLVCEKDKTALYWAIYNNRNTVIRFLLNQPKIAISAYDKQLLVKAGYLPKQIDCIIL